MKKPKNKTRSPYFVTPAGYVLGIGLSGGVFLIGVYFAVCSIIEGRGTEYAQGTVVALEEQRTSDGVSHRPVVQYEVNGKSYRCTGKVGTKFDHVGDKIAVPYKIDRPEIAYIDSFSQRWGIPLVFCCLGGFFLVGILHYALFGSKSTNQDPAWHNVRVDETNGRRIVIRWFSSLCWGMLIFCVLWDAFLITMGLENSCIFPLPHIVGIAFTYLTLAFCFNRTTVKVSELEIRVRHWPFPWIGNKVLPCETIRHLSCVPGLTITGAAGPYKSLVNMKAVLSDGSECTLLRSLDKSDGLAVQRQLEKWLKAAQKPEEAFVGPPADRPGPSRSAPA